MMSIRIAVVLGLALGLAACQTDLGENLGGIFKRDASGPADSDAMANPPPAPDLWGPERGPAGTSRPSVRTAPFSAINQFQCTAAIVKETELLVAQGKLTIIPSSGDERTRRTCVVAGLCDTIDGVADYFYWTQVLNGPQEREFLEICPGVETYGPRLIAREPDLFVVARRIRDEHQAAFRSGGTR